MLSEGEGIEKNVTKAQELLNKNIVDSWNGIFGLEHIFPSVLLKIYLELKLLYDKIDIFVSKFIN